MTNIDLFYTALHSLRDFRKPQGQRYNFYNILTIIILSMASGCDDFESMALFCKKKSDFLIRRKLLDGKNYPSHDLFRYFLMSLDKSALANILVMWLELNETPMPPTEIILPKLIHIDGKVLRASRTSEHSRTGLTVLNAFCSNTAITIGEMIVDKKSCEKAAIPKLIETLYLQNSVVTIDAAGTMTHVAAAIFDKKADYILALKKNNKLFYYEVESFFQHFTGTKLIQDVSQTVDNQSGRIEKRICSIITDLKYFPDAANWKGIKTLIHVRSERTINSKTTIEDRYYISSLRADARALNYAIRRHWSIENELHWHLDVAFNEDKLRLREKNAALSLAVIRRFVLALIKQLQSKESIKAQRLAFAWNENDLDNLFKINNLQFS
jgi:predicted transposase YbfD/YdcC